MTAARELFAEHGVSGVTTQQVARRADVANGTLTCTRPRRPSCWARRRSIGVAKSPFDDRAPRTRALAAERAPSGVRVPDLRAARFREPAHFRPT
ncbi:helix-turn-helix domain-containing protein [Saccharothrix stipae]